MGLPSFEQLSITTGPISGMDTPPLSSTDTEGFAQTPGEVMEVMRTFRDDENGMWVYAGDRVEILGYMEPSDEIEDRVHVRHMSQNLEFSMSWHCLLPYGTRESCTCHAYKCRCVHEDFDESREFAERRAAEKDGGKRHSFDRRISDPATLEGQTPGALLIVKQTHRPDRPFPLSAEVGDFIELKGQAEGHSSNMIEAKNIRTGKEGVLPWKCVFPVGNRAICDCHTLSQDKTELVVWSYNCRCVYDDFQESERHIQKFLETAQGYPYESGEYISL